MQTFINKHWTGKRDYECTNVIACQAAQAPDANWLPCDESILNGLTQLYIERGVRYFGHL